MEDRLRALFAEFKLGRSPSPTRLHRGERLDYKEIPLEKEEHKMDSAPTCMRVGFPRWEDGDPMGWLSHVERYFHFHGHQRLPWWTSLLSAMKEMLYRSRCITIQIRPPLKRYKTAKPWDHDAPTSNAIRKPHDKLQTRTQRS
ncbi:hypothetical protein BHM03_00007907 [Ensete ventricosum]|uniref:Uncharacterized protein n=1 Tax=Ensete ventricosum TaxID=4639 RepID=A0A445MCD4_ENSVE|nr:hypothetical protein BHM03_00007907 [Ensete ventricosum]